MPPVAPASIAAASGAESALVIGDISVGNRPAPQVASNRSEVDSADTVPLVDPRASTPLVDRLDELEDRAERGDKSAACQLATEMDLCWRMPLLRNFIQQMEQEAAGRTVDASNELVPDIAALENDIERGESLCNGLSEAQLSSAWIHQLRSARLGDAEAGYRFLTSPPLDPERFADDLEGWSEYLRSFRPLLEQLVAAGHIPATYFAQGLYAGTDQVGVVTTQPIQPDLYRAAVLAHVLMNSADPSIRAMVDANTLRRSYAELSAEQLRNAEREARSLMNTAFKHSDFSSERTSWNKLGARSSDDC